MQNIPSCPQCTLENTYLNGAHYICPDCGARFRPTLKDMFWAHHTAKTRLLTCTKCQSHGWCVETYGKSE